MVGFKLFILLALYVAIGFYGYRLRDFPLITHLRSLVLLVIAHIALFYWDLQSYIYLCIGILYGFFVLPQLLIAFCNRYVSRGDYSTAKYSMAICCFLDPSIAHFQTYRYYTAMNRVSLGECEINAVRELVETFSENPFSQLAKVTLNFLEARYEDVLNAASYEACEKMSALRPLRWAALGELGRLDQLVSEMHAMRRTLRPGMKPEDCWSLRALGAYTGHEAIWGLYANKLFSRVNPIQSRFWAITYNLVRDANSEVYQEKLNCLLDEAHYRDKKLIENRLQFSVIGSDTVPLSAESIAKLDEMVSVPVKKVSKPFQFKDYLKELSTAYASITLFVLYAVFNIWVGSQPFEDNAQRYYHFGAFIYPLNCNWESFWRIFTASLIYSNGADLWVNLSIFLFFPGVEKTLGHFRFLSLFFISGIVSVVLPVAIWSLFSLYPQVVVLYTLPSCIAGFWGALLILAYVDWRNKGFHEAKHRFWRVLGFVLFIGLFELKCLKISDAIWLHSFGFMTGLTLTAVYLQLSEKKSISSAFLWKPVLVLWSLVAYSIISFIVFDANHRKPLTPDQMNTFGYTYFVTGDMNKSTLWYLKSAHAGNGQAQQWVGYEFAFGKNVPVDEAVGKAWLKKAVAQGNTQAALDLARLEESHEHYFSALGWAHQALKLEKDTKEFAKLRAYVHQLEQAKINFKR